MSTCYCTDGTLSSQQIIRKMKLFESYKKNPKIEEHYDTIVIGSGPGSLTTASYLARNGDKVLILEKHYTPGGFTHVFKRPEYEWDVGVHYIGEVLSEGSIMKSIFDDVSGGKLKWADMGEVYDRIFFGDKEYQFVKGVSNFKEQMKTYFPDPVDQQSIDDYVHLLFKVASASRSYFVEKSMPPVVSKLGGYFMRKGYLKYAEKTVYETLRELTDNEELIGVLTGQYGDYGLPPKQASFVMHAAVAKHYLRGGAYPVGGAEEIFNTMAPLILKNGSQILVNAGVEKVIVKNNKVKGVELWDGKIIHADKVVSGIGFFNTLNTLPDEAKAKYPIKDTRDLKPSSAHLCLYIGLKESSAALNLPKANYWLYPDNYDHDDNIAKFEQNPEDADFPVLYVSFPSSKDPDWEKHYPGKSTIEVITVAPYEIFEEWEEKRWKKRGEDYEALKERYAQRMLEKLYEREPQLKGKIDYYELSTPLSTKHFCNYDRGEIYGLSHDPQRFDQKYLRPHTPIKNFYLTGQDTVSAGIGGAMISGVLTASAISKKNILGAILKSKVG